MGSHSLVWTMSMLHFLINLVLFLSTYLVVIIPFKLLFCRFFITRMQVKYRPKVFTVFVLNFAVL